MERLSRPVSFLNYVRAIPKAELHVHLEGTIRPSTLLALAERNGVDLPTNTEDGLQRWFSYRDFSHFVQVFVTCCRCLQSADDYEQAVYEYGAELSRQNVRYAEITFSASEHHLRGISHDTYMTGLRRGRERVRKAFNIEINWIFNIVRKWTDHSRLNRMADYVTEVAIDGKDEGVVALGLGGDEAGAPPELFARWFDRARAAGLHSAPHAGELAGPDSVWGALDELGAERIGHGVRAIEDNSLVSHLVQHRIPLEICPYSNLRLGVYDRLDKHPLPRLHQAGVVVTVNSDDPPLFNTSLMREYEALVEDFGLTAAAIDEIALNGIRAAFLPPSQKSKMELRFRQEIATLTNLHLS